MANHQDTEAPPTMLGGIQVGTEEPPSRSRAARPRPVVVTDIQVPFGSLVAFIMKCALASIPAVLLLATVGQLVGSVLARLSR